MKQGIMPEWDSWLQLFYIESVSRLPVKLQSLRRPGCPLQLLPSRPVVVWHQEVLSWRNKVTKYERWKMKKYIKKMKINQDERWKMKKYIKNMKIMKDKRWSLVYQEDEDNEDERWGTYPKLLFLLFLLVLVLLGFVLVLLVLALLVFAVPFREVTTLLGSICAVVQA